MALFATNIDDAVRAAIAMHEGVREWNARRAPHGYDVVKIGIGIHTGRVMLGTIGESERMDGTVIADAVNLASRIESLTKNYGAGILISDSAHSKMSVSLTKDIRLVDRVIVKGKTEPVKLFEIFSCDETLLRNHKSETLHQFEQGLIYYSEGKLAEAKTVIQTIIDKNPADGSAVLYPETY